MHANTGRDGRRARGRRRRRCGEHEMAADLLVDSENGDKTTFVGRFDPASRCGPTATSSSSSTPRSSSSSISRRVTRSKSLRSDPVMSELSPGPAALLGNGSLLATLSARAAVSSGCSGRSLDRGSHLGELAFGIELPARRAGSRTIAPSSRICRTRTCCSRALATSRSTISFTSTSRFCCAACVPARGGGSSSTAARSSTASTRALAASVDGNRVVFYRRDVALAVGAVGAEAFSTEPRRNGGWDFLPASRQRRCRARLRRLVARGRRAARRRAPAGLRRAGYGPPPARCRQDFVGARPADVGARRRLALPALAAGARPADRPRQRRRDRGARARPALRVTRAGTASSGDATSRSSCSRSSPPAAAISRRRALRWLPRAQEPEGLWLQRHWTDGSLAPSWCKHQLDETGAVLFAYEAAWRALQGQDAGRRPVAVCAARGRVPARDDRELTASRARRPISGKSARAVMPSRPRRSTAGCAQLRRWRAATSRPLARCVRRSRGRRSCGDRARALERLPRALSALDRRSRRSTSPCSVSRGRSPPSIRPASGCARRSRPSSRSCGARRRRAALRGRHVCRREPLGARRALARALAPSGRRRPPASRARSNTRWECRPSSDCCPSR